MRYSILLSAALMVPALAFSQVTVVSGQATNVAPGGYSAPFVPRISTPMATFATPPLQVGASNATEGNIAGASAMIPVQVLGNLATTSDQGPGQGGFNTGASMPQEAFGVAQLAAGRSPSRPAVRKFTNSDIEQRHAADPQ